MLDLRFSFDSDCLNTIFYVLYHHNHVKYLQSFPYKSLKSVSISWLFSYCIFHFLRNSTLFSSWPIRLMTSWVHKSNLIDDLFYCLWLSLRTPIFIVKRRNYLCEADIASKDAAKIKLIQANKTLEVLQYFIRSHWPFCMTLFGHRHVKINHENRLRTFKETCLHSAQWYWQPSGWDKDDKVGPTIIWKK